jgi:hypothetical protein
MGLILLVLALLLPAVASAQTVSPTSPAHPSMPWGLGTAIPTGQLIRWIWVEPQYVVVDSLVPGPAPEASDESASSGNASAETTSTEPTILRQTYTIPGYWVRETTAGLYYPERWTLEQVGRAHTSGGCCRRRFAAARITAF